MQSLLSDTWKGIENIKTLKTVALVGMALVICSGLTWKFTRTLIVKA